MGAGGQGKGVIFAEREGGESYIALTKKARLRIALSRENPEKACDNNRIATRGMLRIPEVQIKWRGSKINALSIVLYNFIQSVSSRFV